LGANYVWFCFQGVDKAKSTFLLSIIGIVNTIGRVLCGFVADMPQVRENFTIQKYDSKCQFIFLGQYSVDEQHLLGVECHRSCLNSFLLQLHNFLHDGYRIWNRHL
jgi:hypothetical protein